jgi:CBS-domain-containing membrane protein
MVLLHVNHPAAGATTMIVSLGILAKPEYLPIIEIAVVLLTAQAFAINRLAGLPYPIWRSQTLHTGALNERRNAYHRNGDRESRRAILFKGPRGPGNWSGL